MEIRRGIVKAFDPASYTATVQVAGSLGNWLAGVPVAKHLSAGLLAPGARCGVIFFDPANPGDACLAFVYEGAPGAWVSDGMLEGNISGSKVVATTTTARGTVELAEAGEVAAALAVQANDPRLSDARTPLEHDAGKHTNRTLPLWLPVRDWGVMEGSPDLAMRGTAAWVKYEAWAFDAALGEGIGTVARLPDDYAGGSMVIKFVWAASDASSGNVRWGLGYRTAAPGQSIYVSDEGSGSVLGAANGQHIVVESQVYSGSTGLAAGDYIRLTALRDGGHSTDTYAADAWLIGVLILYPAVM